MNCWSKARYIWVSNSYCEPRAMKKNCNESLVWFLPNPSAMFEGIETALLLIWLVKPYNSSFGNDLVVV